MSSKPPYHYVRQAGIDREPRTLCGRLIDTVTDYEVWGEGQGYKLHGNRIGRDRCKTCDRIAQAERRARKDGAA